MADNFQQKQSGFMTYPGGGWRKWMFKAPLTLWRLGLGRVIGRVMVLIIHTGRKSGQPRQTMAEYYTMNGRKYVVAAFGRKAQWALNMLADPRVTIQTASGAESARAIHVTDDQEVLAATKLFMAHDATITNWYLDSLDISRDFSDLPEKKDRTYFFRFDPTDEITPLPQKADLVWVWAVVCALAALLLWLLLRN